MQIKIEKRDSKERLTVEVQNSNAAKALASWLGTANFRVSAEVVFGEEAPAAEPVAASSEGPAPRASKKPRPPAPDGAQIGIVRDAIAKNPGMTLKLLVERTDVPTVDAKACLAWLKDAGQIASRGKGPGTTYSVVPVA